MKDYEWIMAKIDELERSEEPDFDLTVKLNCAVMRSSIETMDFIQRACIKYLTEGT